MPSIVVATSSPPRNVGMSAMGVGDGVGDAVGDGVGDGVGDAVGDGVGDGVARGGSVQAPSARQTTNGTARSFPTATG
jgi:hypothetical protein